MERRGCSSTDSVRRCRERDRDESTAQLRGEKKKKIEVEGFWKVPDAFEVRGKSTFYNALFHFRRNLLLRAVSALCSLAIIMYKDHPRILAAVRVHLAVV